jgi:hypothetical protein
MHRGIRMFPFCRNGNQHCGLGSIYKLIPAELLLRTGHFPAQKIARFFLSRQTVRKI